MVVFTLVSCITKIQTITFYKPDGNDGRKKKSLSFTDTVCCTKGFYGIKNWTNIKGKNNLTLINTVTS